MEPLTRTVVHCVANATNFCCPAAVLSTQHLHLQDYFYMHPIEYNSYHRPHPPIDKALFSLSYTFE